MKQSCKRNDNFKRYNSYNECRLFLLIIEGTSISGWIIVTLCIAGCIILTGLGYLIRTYRQRLSVKSRIKNEGSILEPLGPAPYIGVYDEIDENPLTFDTADSNVTPQEPHYETVDCVSQERLSITSSTEHDDTGYLDPYFALEDESDKLQDRTSQTECSSTNSSNSDVVDQDIIAYKNIYQPLQENWQDNSHGYDIPVMVHEGFECSAGFDENTTSNSYYNVYKPLQKDMDITNPTYENQKSPETKAGNDKGFYGDACSSKITTGNLHDYINMQAESKISINNCDEMESCKPFDEDNVKKIDQQSFSGDF
ncbi:Hypothetical predicted protein [Mytilus galloprovincialis]|uniref:Uncharacterized protein n=1 Tax=Mytilus galloprovincialis TaxID=29158 RepID=A0A8B6FUZ2_MYTGA|nr:Hypothetical predicted protein [Mytilus galloprovincialis]